MSKLFKNISIFSISLLLVLTTFTTNISADEKEIYTSENQVLSIELERTLKGQELELTFKNHVLDEEDIEIEKIVFQDEKEIEVEKNKDYLFKQIVGENGNYKFEITYTRIFLLEEENKEIKREETMTFYVAVNEIEVSAEDEIEVVEEKLDVVEEQGQEDEGIAYYFPKSDRVETFSEEEIATYSANTRASGVTVGEKITGATTFYWKAEPSYRFDFPAGFSEIYVNGEVGYCIEPSVIKVATGSATAKDLDTINQVWVMQGRKAGEITKTQKDNITLIANYGYEYEGHQTKAYRWATQKMIFEELGWVMNSSTNTANEEKVIRDLVARHTERPAWNNTTKKVKIGETIDLSDPTISNFKIESVADLEVVSHSGNTLKVKVTGKTPKLLLTKKQGVLEGTPSVYSDGSSQKVLVSKISDPILARLNLEIDTGNIELEKVDENGKNIAGVEFAISKNSNMSTVIKKAKTNAQGKVSFTDLDAGTYYYQEVSVPSPLVIDKTIKSIVVNGGETAKAKVTNKIAKGNVQVIKQDTANQKVQGAKFNVLNSSGAVVDTLTTNASGTATSKTLPLGNYSLVEIFVPAPYILDSTPIPFALTYKDQNTPIVSVSKTQTNEKAKGNVQVIKQNTANQKVQGAKFNVLNSSGAVVDTLTTNASGTATSKTLPLGNYSLVEIFVPAPYILDSTPIPFALTYKDQNTPIVSVSKTQTNEIVKGKIEIVKKESAIDNPEYIDQKLANAVFELRAKDEIKEFGTVVYRAGDLVATLTTDENGKAVKDNLPLGEYTLKETKAPEGYLLDDTVHTLSINYKDQNTAVVSVGKTLENKVIKGKIQVVKTDRTSLFTKGLPNAIFGVYKADTDEKVDEIVTDKNGFAFTKELRYGNYYLKELKAPLGYWLDSTKYPVSIKDHDVVEVQHVGNDMIQAKIKVIKTDSDTDLPIENVEFKILDENNDVVSIKFQEGNEVKTQDTFITDKNGVFILQAFLPYGTYKLVETKAPEQYLPIDPIEFTIDENQNYIDLEVIGLTLPMEIENDWKKGNIEIAKVDLHSGEVIAGTIFELYDSEFDLIDTLTTDENGKVQVDDLKYGMYYIKEIEVPFPYVINPENELQNIFVQEHGKTYTVTFENVKTEINIFKVDKETGEPIADTVFELYNEDKELLETLTTDENGLVTVEGLDLGKYFVKEIKVPFPYVINPENDLQELELTEENNSYDIKFENVKTEINIFKVDKETGEPIADTVFELYNEDKELLETLTTDENGLVTVEGLELGKYFVKEIEVPFPYVINPENDLQELELTEENNSYDIKFENVKTEINIFKVDKETGEPIADTVFELYNEDKELLETLTTDENGLVTVEGLELGKYFVKEIEVPAPYIINPKNELQELELTEENNSYDIKFENEKAVGEITVIKTDDFDEVVGNAEFTLYDEDMNVVKVATTDENGLILFDNLPLGNYIVKETKAPLGYDLNDQEFNVELAFKDQNTPIVESVVEVENKRTEVDIIVKKVDKTTKEILKDAEFTLYDEDMNVIEVATTDENGIARFTVTFGNYKLKETKAPEGYLLSKEIIDIEIKGNEENLEYVIEFDNEIMPTGLVQTGMNNDLPMLLATSGSLITMGLYLVLKNKREENEKGI